jgi:glycosyltransferase involved in cell wall biosynthesis
MRAEPIPAVIGSPTRVSGCALSIVVPVHNEAANIDAFFARLIPVLEKLAASYEIICVNDGSADDSLAQLLKFRERLPTLKIINLSRNFGKDIALSAGIDHASGAAVIPIDADLQDPPELISEMVTKWREGFDVVYGQRISRESDAFGKQITARMFYLTMERLTDVPMPRDAGDFRLIDRRVVDVLKKLPERSRFMKGLFAWVGFRQAAVPYNRATRHGGDTNWSYWRLWNFAIDGITSFSSSPLKIWSYVGLVISALSFLYALLLATLVLIHGIDVPGYASLMVVVLFLGGIQLITLGIIGEYIGRVYNEVKGRPLYLVSDLYGFEEKP